MKKQYSKEWVEKNDSNESPNFSIKEIFLNLKPGKSKNITCDGLGKIIVYNEDNECFVTIDGKRISYKKLTGEELFKKDKFIGLIILLLTITIIWAVFWWATDAYYDFERDTEKVSQDRGTFGDMFGAINALFSGLALAGVIYAIFLQRGELKLQRKELRETRHEFEIQNETLASQRFENTFFQMIQLHHEIVDKLFYSKDDFDLYTKNLVKTNNFEKRNMLSEAADTLNQLLNTRTRENKDQDIITLKNKESKIIDKNAWNNISHAYCSFYYDFSFGTKLGHYFMNLYHIFKFVYESQHLSKPQKRNYGSIARSQLSQDELYLLFYNAIFENHGNPKFLFLIKEFNIMENFDRDKVNKFDSHNDIFEYLLENSFDQLDSNKPIPIKPPKEFHQD